jgi:hypothetical protein
LKAITVLVRNSLNARLDSLILGNKLILGLFFKIFFCYFELLTTKFTTMDYKEILKQANIKGVKSYKQLYGTKLNMFAFFAKGYADSSWYCKILEDSSIVINTKYYEYSEAVISYNNSLRLDT